MSTRPAGNRPAVLAFTGVIALLLASCAAEAPRQPDPSKTTQVTPPPPPPPVPRVPPHLLAPVRPVTETLHGTAVTDPYRYFEDLKNPEVAAHMKAQDAYGRGVLDKIRATVVPLRRTLLDADALVALLGFVPGLVASVGDAAGSSAQWLATLGLGLDDAAGAASQVSGPLQQVSGVLDLGVDAAEGALALVAPEQWTGVLAGLDHVMAALAALKEPPAAPA